MGTTLSQPASACPVPEKGPDQGLDTAAQRRRLTARLAGLRAAGGLLPVCGWCRKIRNGAGTWMTAERGLLEGAGPALTHGVCPDCARSLLGGRHEAA